MKPIITVEPSVILNAKDAHLMAVTLIQIDKEMRKTRGARLKPDVLKAAVVIASSTGTTEVEPTSLNETVEYERIDTKEAAKILGCTERNVTDLATRERIPAERIAGRWHFFREDVEIYRKYSE